MASQYDEMREQANAMRQNIASSQMVSPAIKQRTDAFLTATAEVKAGLASTHQNAIKVIHTVDSMKNNQMNVERPEMTQNSKQAKKKVLF